MALTCIVIQDSNLSQALLRQQCFHISTMGNFYSSKLTILIAVKTTGVLDGKTCRWNKSLHSWKSSNVQLPQTRQFSRGQILVFIVPPTIWRVWIFAQIREMYKDYESNFQLKYAVPVNLAQKAFWKIDVAALIRLISQSIWGIWLHFHLVFAVLSTYYL